MRKAFVEVVEEVMDSDENLVLLLGDIGVHGFRKSFEKHPARTINIGILEQSMVSVAAGLAKEGMIPVLHTIAPFMVERALEQIKVDFAYQKMRGNLVSVGASFDYAALGSTHHCPGDVGILINVPSVQIITPGTAEEFKDLFLQAYKNSEVTYFRLSESQNSISQKVEIGKGVCIQEGHRATVISIGPTLDIVQQACVGQDVEILYLTSIRPLDINLIRAKCKSGKILLVEPYYSGAILPHLVAALTGRSVRFELIGVPHEFLREYGSPHEHAESIGLTPNNIRERLEKLIHD